MRHQLASWLMIGVGSVAVGCANVGLPNISIPSGLGSIPSGAANAGPSGSIEFHINGNFVSTTGGSLVSFSQGDDPDARFSGVTGCDSRHFLADYSDDITLLFGYTASRATLLMNDEVYEWDGPPDSVNGRLHWDGDFDATGGNPALSIQIDVDCPMPRAT